MASRRPRPCFGPRTSHFALLAALFLSLPPGLPAADTNTVITQWLAAQTHFTTWSADFVQTRSFKTLQQPLISTGRVWFAKPNWFRWELGRPAQTIAVRDDTQLLVIYPRLKRAERYPVRSGQPGPLSEALGLLDAGFPQSRADFDARFRVAALQRTDAAWLLELQPASASARRLMPVVRVTLAQETFLLLANELVFPDGNNRSKYFTLALD